MDLSDDERDDLIFDTRNWQFAHRHILKHLWAAHAQQTAIQSGQNIENVVADQIDDMQSTLPKTMSAQAQQDARAKIGVVGYDVLDVILRNGQRK